MQQLEHHASALDSTAEHDIKPGTLPLQSETPEITPVSRSLRFSKTPEPCTCYEDYLQNPRLISGLSDPLNEPPRCQGRSTAWAASSLDPVRSCSLRPSSQKRGCYPSPHALSTGGMSRKRLILGDLSARLAFLNSCRRGRKLRVRVELVPRRTLESLNNPHIPIPRPKMRKSPGLAPRPLLAYRQILRRI